MPCYNHGQITTYWIVMKPSCSGNWKLRVSSGIYNVSCYVQLNQVASGWCFIHRESPPGISNHKGAHIHKYKCLTNGTSLSAHHTNRVKITEHYQGSISMCKQHGPHRIEQDHIYEIKLSIFFITQIKTQVVSLNKIVCIEPKVKIYSRA